MKNHDDLQKIARFSTPYEVGELCWEQIISSLADKYGSSFLMLGGPRSKYVIIALSFSELDFQSVLTWPVSSHHLLLDQTHQKRSTHFRTGLIGVLSYDEFSPASFKRSPSRVFYVGRSLVIDTESGISLIFSDDGYEALPIQISLDHAIAPCLSKRKGNGRIADYKIKWDRLDSDASYRNRFFQCQSDIRSGRYYQINLLRYYQAHCGLAPASYWWQQLKQFSGPFAAWLRLKDFELVSFSPERFVQWQAILDGAKIQIQTEPIKGTMGVKSDPVEDAIAKGYLLSSEKDQAELHMIVDLMRNDLLKICEPGSVLVKDKGSLHSFTTVHHLIARITGLLREPQSFGSILAVLCPGGSITGTPKIEVMRAIYDYESRPRDYFMGNIFCWDLKSQYFDSSILIRTVQKRVGIDHYEFAAGSGLVIGSELLAEMEEISAKARVVVN